MRELRLKGQALALVLIVIVVAIVVAFAITNRVVEDIRQQGEERASTRAETIAEGAIEQLTMQIQSQMENVMPATGEQFKIFAISNEAPDGSAYETLDLCKPDSEADVSEQCDKNSLAQINYYKQIIQFKLFSNESIEAFMENTNESTGSLNPIIIHLKNNDSFQKTGSHLLVKGFVRKVPVSGREGGGSNSAPILQVVGDCIIQLNAGDTASAACLPNTTLEMNRVTCPTDVPVIPNPAEPASQVKTSLAGEDGICFEVSPKTPVSTYRIKPMLAARAQDTEVPYVDVSVTGASAESSYLLPVNQMAMITAGVFAGATGSDQQVYQQSTRLLLINKTVPEIADYVLYNGSDKPITKCKTSTADATCGND